MKRVAFAILTSMVITLAGACSDSGSVTAPVTSAGEPRFDGGGMAGSGGRSTTLPPDSTDSGSSAGSTASTPGDDGSTLNGGMAGSGG
jgi:hypothetical protein